MLIEKQDTGFVEMAKKTVAAACMVGDKRESIHEVSSAVVSSAPYPSTSFIALETGMKKSLNILENGCWIL
jgi:hypothetical protein